jgi:hypothetical protein
MRNTVIRDAGPLGLHFEICKTLPRRLRDQLALLENWDLTDIRRRVKRDLGIRSSKALRMESEYKRFLALALLNPEKSYGMAGLIDEFWHRHVLDTPAYVSMCETIFGKYVHHLPDDGKRNSTEDYAAHTIPDLSKYFAVRKSRLWPSATHARCNSCKSCGNGNCGRMVAAT